MRADKTVLLGAMIGLCGSVFGLAGAGQPDREQEVERLIADLGQRESWQRALEELVEIGAPAVKPLVRTLEDESVSPWTIHARCIEVLIRIGTPEATEAVVGRLEDKTCNEYVRGSAALAVARLKPEAAVRILGRTSRDESRMVRWKSVQALGKLGDAAGVNALALALKDQDQYVRAAAARSLGEIASAQAAQGLVHALSDSNWAVRLNTRNALLEIGSPAIEPLLTALRSGSNRVLWQAAWALGKLDAAAAVVPLADLLADPDWMVRDEAAIALTRIKSETVVKVLKEVSEGGVRRARGQAAWSLETIGKGRPTGEFPEPTEGATATVRLSRSEDAPGPLFPHTFEAPPAVASPCVTADGVEFVTAHVKGEGYALVPVTVENGTLWDYRQRRWGKGRQLVTDAADFATLAETGLHSRADLDRTKTITRRSIVLITELGRPGRSSGAGFMADDEDILSVIKGDNHLVRGLGLTHPQVAWPLFHVWNLVLRSRDVRGTPLRWSEFDRMLYNGKTVLLKIEGTRGWQESLFEDEILGMYQFEIWRELEPKEREFLRTKYPGLSEAQMTASIKKLSYLHTGEMVPYYIMRYGFYEGHTDYRSDPIAIAFIFGLKSLAEIEAAFPGQLHEKLTTHFTRDP